MTMSVVDAVGNEKVDYIEISPWTKFEHDLSVNFIEPESLAVILSTAGSGPNLCARSSRHFILSPAEASSTLFSGSVYLCNLAGLAGECMNTFLGIGRGMSSPGNDFHELITIMLWNKIGKHTKIMFPEIGISPDVSLDLFTSSLRSLSGASEKSMLAFLPTVFGRNDENGDFVMTGYAQGPMIKAENGETSFMRKHYPFCSDDFEFFDATGVDFVWITFRDSESMHLIERRAWTRHDYCKMVFKKLEKIVYSQMKVSADENPGDRRLHFQWDYEVALKKKSERKRKSKMKRKPSASYVTESTLQSMPDENHIPHLRTIKSFSSFLVDLYAENPAFEVAPLPIEGIPHPFSRKRACSAPARWPASLLSNEQ
jgi:hypothetical protein